jgi:hypothetical protein
MSYGREQFLANLAQSKESNARAMLPHAHALHAAAVSQELLTHDPHWDRYLSLLQAMREQVQTRKQDAERKQSDRTIWEAKDLFKLKSDVIEADAMLGLLDTIMALPKALHEGGEKARELINQFEKAADDQSAPAQTA